MWAVKFEYEYDIICGEEEHHEEGVYSEKIDSVEKPDIDPENIVLNMDSDIDDESIGIYNLAIWEIDENPKFEDTSTGEDINKNEKTPENVDNIETSTTPNVSIEATEQSDIETYPGLLNDVVNSFTTHAAWDPRLYRIDEYFINDQKNVMRIPFASQTAATAFADLSNIMEVGAVQAFIDNGDIKSDSELAKKYQQLKIKPDSEASDVTEQSQGTQSNNYFRLNSDLDITNPTKDLEENSFNWGVQSIVNPYSLTKLMGGLELEGNNIINYMYDIRDQRRFYGLAVNDDSPLTVSNPTVTQLIKWSNADQWGRTPYSFQDFVYCKYFGLIPNNRLITFRRYSVPTYDNLQFENMYGDVEKTTQNRNGDRQTEKNNEKSTGNPEGGAHKTFSPHAYVVTWFGGETGNSLSSLMSFSTGINWSDLEAQIWEVSGDTGESKQAVIDKFLGDGDHSTLFPTAELDTLNSFTRQLSMISAKIASFGKFNLAMTGEIGPYSQDVYDKIAGANVDPFDATFRNRIKGPVNRIDKVKKRDPGIKFSQSLNIKCAYKAKAIGGINPKAALLDVLGNCLEMVSPHAVFWGGGHRFMIHPQVYPFHDGGWRDSFMAKIYDGKFLGDKGAIATVLSGFKKVGENGEGEFSFDTAKNYLKGMGGAALNLLGQAISSLSDLFGGGDFLNKIGSGLQDAGEEIGGEQGQEMASHLLTNLKRMWHNRMMAQTAVPQINAQGNILIGEPTGEWHLTIGNPLNPIAVIGNLICSEMKVTWDEELGPDDFPEGFSVEYTIEHAMARDSDAIQSMFNRGMGKYYALPDYIKLSSNQTTHVDKFTKNVDGATGNIKFLSPSPLMGQYGTGYQTYKIEKGSTPKNSGNWNTTLITKFTPINSVAQRSVHDRQTGIAQGSQNIVARVRSLAATRKLTNE